MAPRRQALIIDDNLRIVRTAADSLDGNRNYDHAKDMASATPTATYRRRTCELVIHRQSPAAPFARCEPPPHGKRQDVDNASYTLLLAIGGVSVLDGTKFVAIAAKHEGADATELL